MLSSETNALLTHTLASFWRKQSCLGLGHETMVSAVCLSIFSCAAPTSFYLATSNMPPKEGYQDGIFANMLRTMIMVFTQYPISFFIIFH